MFGLGDQNHQSNDDPAMLDNVKQLASQPADDVVPTPPVTQDDASAPTVTDDNGQTGQSRSLHGFTMDDQSAVNQTSDNSQPSETSTADEAQPEQTLTEPPHVSAVSAPSQADDTDVDDEAPSMPDDGQDASQSSLPPVDTNHLAGLKQQALEHLEPLTEHIDGTPEERFKTTMMMIQANDNHTLLEKALEAAKAIEDDKVRAQAMLDIVNEINYFSQTNNDTSN